VKAKRHAMLKGKIKTPVPVILLIVAFLCPTEFSLYIAGLRIPPHRLALILLFPLVLWRFASQKKLKVRAFDVVFVLFNIWTVGIFMYHQGQQDGMIYGGSLALDGFGAYLVARTCIRDLATFHATLRALGIAIAVAALIALPETLLGHIFTHDALRSLTGYVHPTAEETRMHLTRAYGTFDHPIHYGTFCAALLSLFWYAAKSATERHKRAMILTGATLLGLSSAPMLCLALQAAMLIWEKQTRGTANRTGIALAVLTGLYIGAASVMTRSPLDFIATGMTLDPWTGFYRLQIWEHGLENVYASPWTGIGLKDWVRPWWMASSTIDAFWLVICLREGVPAFLLLATAIVLNTRAVVKRGLKSPDIAVRRLSRGWIMSLIALSLVGVTVHYWNVLYAFFFFFMGLAGWIADPVRARVAAKSKAKQRRPVVAPLAPLPRPTYAGGFANGPLPAPA
jgi:hypothetical protein